MNQFSRTEMLLGKEAMLKLQAAKVIVFGIGGVGGYAAESLARSGVGAVALCDDDTICLTNINRQIIATHATIGKLKTAVMAERLLQINPALRVRKFDFFYNTDTAEKIDLSAYDYIIDAIDTVTAKLLLAEKAAALGIPIISCMGTGNKLDPTMLEVADIFDTVHCPLAKVMRKELRRRAVERLKVVYSKELPLTSAVTDEYSCKKNCICPPDSAKHCEQRRQVPGSVSFVPPAAGLILAGEVVKDLVFYRSQIWYTD